MNKAARFLPVPFLVGVMLFSLTACAQPSASSSGSSGSQPAGKDTQQPIVIGLVTEVTGPQAGTGDNQTNGIKLAFDEVNQKGGIKGRQIKLVIEDDASTPPGTVNAYNKIIADQKPVATFIPNFANFDMAVEPAIKKAGIPAITGASGPGVTAVGNPWIFRVRTNDDIMGKLAAEYAVKEMGAKKIAILSVTGEMGAGASKVVKETLEKLGLAPRGDGVLQHGRQGRDRAAAEHPEGQRRSGNWLELPTRRRHDHDQHEPARREYEAARVARLRHRRRPQTG